MMSNYQISYIKMETALKNWMKWTNAKVRLGKMKKAFDVMKQKAMVHRQAKIYQKKLIVQKVNMVFKRLEGCGQQINKGRMIEAF